MTQAQKSILLFLADVYLRLGRPKRSLMLLMTVAKEDPEDVELCRLSLRNHLVLGNNAEAIALVERLVEHEFSSHELAFALSAQCRALNGMGEIDAARSAWSECVSLCKTAGLDVMEYAT